jgi:hypothetical protein
MSELGYDKIWDTGNLKYEILFWKHIIIIDKCVKKGTISCPF